VSIIYANRKYSIQQASFQKKKKKKKKKKKEQALLRGMLAISLFQENGHSSPNRRMNSVLATN